MRCVALTESREKKVTGLLDEWLARRPRAGGADVQVDPTELARLLGNLVFASQAVRGGRTAMMATAKWPFVEHLPACWGVQNKFPCLPMTSRSEGAGRRRATAGFGRGRR